VDKTPVFEAPPTKPILDLQFLKRRTRRVEAAFHEFVAIPDECDLLPSLKWVTASLSSDIAVVVNANNTLIHARGWPVEQWQDYRKRLQRALVDAGVREQLMDWRAVQAVDKDFNVLNDSITVSLSVYRRDHWMRPNAPSSLVAAFPKSHARGNQQWLTPQVIRGAFIQSQME
jgi:hypothetical protein